METEVSDQDEPSYYEIALTNRQVLVAFVILLGSVMVAFFAGVWVGRGDRMTISQHLEAAAPEEQEVAVSPEDLEFFTAAEGARVERRPNLQELAETPRTERSLAEDLGVEQRPEPPLPSQPDSPPGEAAPSPPSARAPRDAPPATALESVVIQVFSSRDEEQAQALLDRLRGAGLTAFLSPADGPGGTMHRVRLGPFQERTEAERVAERVRREFRLDTWITSP